MHVLTFRKSDSRQEVVTSIAEITDVNCCSQCFPPLYIVSPSLQKLIQWMELSNFVGHPIMFSSHLQAPAKRLWRQANLHNAARWWHDFPLLARTRRRPLLLHHQLRAFFKTKDEENKEQKKKNNKRNTSMYTVQVYVTIYKKSL